MSNTTSDKHGASHYIEKIRLAWADYCDDLAFLPRADPKADAVDKALQEAMVSVGSRLTPSAEACSQCGDTKEPRPCGAANCPFQSHVAPGGWRFWRTEHKVKPTMAVKSPEGREAFVNELDDPVLYALVQALESARSATRLPEERPEFKACALLLEWVEQGKGGMPNEATLNDAVTFAKLAISSTERTAP
jgi:hypothetical protein